MRPLSIDSLGRHQREWLGSRAFWSAMIGPYGCGKTGACILWAWSRSMANPGRRGLWVEPTFGMIQDIVIPELEEFLDEIGMEETSGRAPAGNQFTLNRSGRPELILPWGVWMFRSAENHYRLKGPTVAWALLDEADQMEKAVEDVVLSRVRDPKANLLQFGHVGTPEKWGSYLHERCDGKARQPGDCVVIAKREDVTWLPAAYYDRMRDSFDARAFEQYGDGHWTLDTEGLIYVPPFSAENIQPCQYQPGLPVLIGMDFNVTPFSFVCCHETDGVLRAFRQYRIRGATSQTAAETIRRDFPDSPVEIWCDPAGAARHTTAVSGSDVRILESAGFEVHFRQVRRVNDRYNATRAYLKSASGRVRLVLDPDGCEQLIREYRTLTYEDAAKPGADNHSSSALDYLVYGKYDPCGDIRESREAA